LINFSPVVRANRYSGVKEGPGIPQKPRPAYEIGGRVAPGNDDHGWGDDGELKR
jgi:hypothetical protein